MKQERVAVGSGAGNDAAGHDAAGARSILHHHRLPPVFGHLLAYHASHEIRGTPWRKRHEHADRFLRKTVLRGRAEGRQDGKCERKTKCSKSLLRSHYSPPLVA